MKNPWKLIKVPRKLGEVLRKLYEVERKVERKLMEVAKKLMEFACKYILDIGNPWAVRGRLEHLLDEGNYTADRINSYAVFMGYLSMAIKGLSFLVLSWTTVVLLGGFVSMLHKKDFWCLTFITLVQTAGIFDVSLNEKLSYVMDSADGLLASVFYGGDRDTEFVVLLLRFLRYLVTLALFFVQLMVLFALLGLLTSVYVFGILMSGGISLWRLRDHDYSNSDGEATNLEPALNTLYYLALLQSVLFCYRFIFARMWRNLVKNVDDESEFQVVFNYLRETRRGCEKNPSFAKGRNLITHAVDMIGSNSPTDCVSGVKLLYTSICIIYRELKEYKLLEMDSRGYRKRWIEKLEDKARGQRMLMKHLVTSASSTTHILNKLLEMLDSRGLHERETRNQAAMIVEHLAFNINLEQFPRGIQQISSLIGTFEQYSIAEPFEQDYLYDEYEQDWKLQVNHQLPSLDGKLGKAYKKLLLQGLCILQKLAANENNCRVMSDNRGLVSKIMAPVIFDLLDHTTDHTTDEDCTWFDIVGASMKVMIQLTGAPGEVGAKLRHEISSCEGALNTLWRILNCKECNDGLQLSAIRILTQVYMDIESSRSTDSVLKKESSSREHFLRMLVDIFTDDKKYRSSIRVYTGKALSGICYYDGISGATVVIQIGGGDVVDSLHKVLAHDKNDTCRQAAAEILEHLCTHYTKDGEYHGKLKEAMTKAMPEVIRAIILHYGDETHTRKDAHQDGSIKPETGIENQCEDNGRGKGNSYSSSSHPQNDKVVGDQTHSGKEVEQDGLAKLETDIENQCDNGQGKGISSFSSSRLQNKEQDKEEKVFQAVRPLNLLSSLLSLCGTFYDTFISELGPDLFSQFQAIFLNELKEKSDLTVENLLLYKAIAKMVISMMKHSGSRFVKPEDLESLIDALSGASKKMLNLDNSMVFNCENSLFATTLPKLSRCTLASIVNEAKEVHTMVLSTSVSG